MADPKLIQSYQCLGLPLGTPLADIKATYRRLARQYHPDVNPGDRTSHERFIALHQAYTYLLEHWATQTSGPAQATGQVRVEVRHPPPERPRPSPLSQEEQYLKHKFQVQWRTLLEQGRFARAVALLDTLAQRFAQDPDIPTWQAQTYQRWGSALIDQGEWDKARTYLKKALRLDPHNRQLWEEVNRQFIRLDQRMNKY